MTAGSESTHGGYEVPRGDWRTSLCAHHILDGCIYCCPACNLGKHICPGCGTDIEHNQTNCGECA